MQISLPGGFRRCVHWSQKKTGSSFYRFKNWSQNISAAAILLGPKKLRILVRSQCQVTRLWLSNASLRILELLGGMYSTYFSLMLYIPSINNKLGPTNMALMASKTWVLKQYVAWSRLLFFFSEWWVYWNSQDGERWPWKPCSRSSLCLFEKALNIISLYI